jgi:Fe(3+) dicitrate transport protein
VEERHTPGAVRSAPRLVSGILSTGAKSEVVSLATFSANLAEKSGRQLFAEVPGIFVYDMDGAGNQVNVSARGLDPHRSWEFNVRQNGVLTTSDLYGYPASHYSPPMEAIERIELVRGTAGLQYGSQFGGMLNYVTKTMDSTRRASWESQNSVGSFGLRSTWDAVGGKAGRLSYYAYVSARQSDGYRQNGQSAADAEFLQVAAPLAHHLTVRLEVGRSRYRYQLPGPLTDAVFTTEPRTATRARNWYSPDIVVPSLLLTWTPRPSTRATMQVAGVFGIRGSIAVGGFANQPDTASTAGVWSTRQIDIDRYNSRTIEWRVLQDSRIAAHAVTWSGGIALSDNDTWRRQRGTGSRGNDYSLTLEPGATFARDLHYVTTNAAAYGEAELQVSTRWTLVPGVRMEHGTTQMRGRLAYYDPADTPRTVRHQFPLFGVRSAYRMPFDAEWYGGWAQSYRPMILKDVLPESATERTDPHLQDAHGWTVESGLRGGLANGASYDVGVFSMRYAGRFGLLTLTDANGAPYTFKTNVGTSYTQGIESRFAMPVGATGGVLWRVFTATSLMAATYTDGSIIAGGRNISVRGNTVESVPRWISRNGISARTPVVDATLQLSYVSRTFADALNTVTPSATGAVGVVPAYSLLDLNGSWNVSRRLRIAMGVNNLLNRAYFTKRPQFYPGPGLWPSDGRSLQLTVHLRPSVR